MALTAQLPLDPGFSCNKHFVPGVSKGVALKSNILCGWACADNLGLM